MSAKPSKKSGKKAGPANETPTAPVSATPVANSVAATADASTAWIDSADPRKRSIGKFVLIAVWLYVGALWLLALDQTFHWGIFGPKLPPLP